MKTGYKQTEVGKGNWVKPKQCDGLLELEKDVGVSRRLRIQVGDGWYHVMSRGNGGETIYRTDEDRFRILGRVAELPERFGTEIDAFVLQPVGWIDCGGGAGGGSQGGRALKAHGEESGRNGV